MGWLNSEKPPSKYDPAYIKLLVEKIRTALNFLDDNNFPNGLSGLNVKQRTLPLSALSQGEWHLPIISLAVPYSTASTEPINVGPFVYISPVTWGASSAMYFEVTGGTENKAASAVFELHGVSGKLAEITIPEEGFSWKRSGALMVPASGQTLVMKMKTTNKDHYAYLLGARLVIKP